MFKGALVWFGGSELELESRIFESLFQRRMLSDFCIVNAAADVLDG